MIGKYQAKLDDKNRLFVPAKLRGELGEVFYVTVGTNSGHRCLTAYTAEGWQRLTEKYDALPISKKGGPTAQLFHQAVECCPDKQFRFTLSQFLLKYAGIDRDVIVAGRAGQAEIWDAAAYEVYEAESLTPENLLASLEDIGL